MDGPNGLEKTTRVNAPVASNTLSVNVFTAPGKTMVGERPKPFSEALGFDPITSTLIFGEYDEVLVEYVPSIGLIVAGDVVYDQCRMYVGDTTPESRKNWIAGLDRLAALNPEIVVAGHKKPGAPDSPLTIQDTKRYLQDFDRLQKTATSDQELFDQMTELYPNWVANQAWLMFGFPQP
jgi:hypothetical protein